MKLLSLVIAPDPLLKQISKPVENVDKFLQEFMDNMVHTMYHEGGIGLASVQVGVLKRILVMDVDYQYDDSHHHHGESCGHNHFINCNPQYFINPEIIESSKEISSFKEGCLSFPGARAEVSRPQEVTVKFLDYYGNPQTKSFDGIMATCIQHEIDHLIRINFVDRISALKREIILKKIKKTK